jgi:hypothetical protein
MTTEQAHARRDHSRLVKFSIAPNLDDGGSMGDLVNLRRFKKRAEREQSARESDSNRTRFGRTKSERVLDQRRAKRASDLLDQHRIDGEDAP